jgi:hypothetical protein
MPLQKLQFRPGVNREGTTLANEGGWFESDKVRFRSGYPEKIGGWSIVDNATNSNGTYSNFVGVARSLWNWATLKSATLLGLATNLKFYIAYGGAYYDITPIRSTAPGGAITFSATANSSTITVTHTNHGGQTGDFVTFSSALSLGGNITAAVLNQQYQITVLTLNTYTIQARTAGTTVEFPGEFVFANASDTRNGGQSYTAATSDVITVATTGLTNGTAVRIYGTPPGGLTTGTTYYVVNASGVTNKLCATAPPATTPVDITSTGSGTITATTGKYGISSGSAIATYSTGWGAGPWNAGADTDIWAHGWGTGYTAGTSGLGAQLRLWSQANFGQTLLFAPREGALYYWDPGAGTTPNFTNNPGVAVTTDNTTQCPTQIYQVMVADASRIVIALGCTNYTATLGGDGLFDPLLVRWSTNENYSVWSPSIANQAGSYRLSRGSQIIAGLQTRQEILIWTDAAFYAMQYLGPPYVFGFTILADNISIMSPNAMATANGVTYWMGTDKFYVYSGRIETLPCALRSYIFNDINRDQALQVLCGTNEGYSEIWWFYCSADSTSIDRYVIFNYLDRVWYYGTLNRTAWLDSPLRQYPQATTSVQWAALTQDIYDETTIPVTDTGSFPNAGVLQINSELITYASKTATSFIDCVRGAKGSTSTSHFANTDVRLYASNLLVFHESIVDDGTTNPPSPIPAYVQSSDFDIGDGHNYGFVWQVIPDITFDGSNTPKPNLPQVTFTIRPRQNPGSNYGTSVSPTVEAAKNQSYAQKNTYNVQQFTEIVYTRARGRQMAFRIDSDTLGTQWQLGTPRMNVRPDGRR